ncbi:MAG: hypothetical protein ACRDF0_06630 [Candidatus Limnocylindria bacterium]
MREPREPFDDPHRARGAYRGLLAAAPRWRSTRRSGRGVADIVRSPDVRVWRLLVLVGVALPAVTGAIDLFLRSRTP